MTLRIKTGSGPYNVHIEKGCINKAGEFMNLDRKCLIVTDDGVPEAYVQIAAAQCKDPYIFTLKSGESSKNMHNLEMLLTYMLDNGFTRGDSVLAVGGGMCGDIAGFAAASYMRGIDFYNIPTTLLSQADSSIGGKTAVNLGGAKNIAGAFWQPGAVLIDTELTESLPQDQITSGMAEIIKSGMIADRELFEYIESNTDLDKEWMLSRSLMVKKNVVEADEREAGLRRILNYGHTIGHGIEVVSGMMHGYAVAIGMLAMSDGTCRERLIKVLNKTGLPTSVSCDKNAVYDAVLKDKKMQGGTIAAVVVEEPGTCDIVQMTPRDIRKRIVEL